MRHEYIFSIIISIRVSVFERSARARFNATVDVCIILRVSNIKAHFECIDFYMKDGC